MLFINILHSYSSDYIIIMDAVDQVSYFNFILYIIQYHRGIDSITVGSVWPLESYNFYHAVFLPNVTSYLWMTLCFCNKILY